MGAVLNDRQLRTARAVMNNYNGGNLIDFFKRSANFKHNLYYDFGYPKTEELTFRHFYELWKRNGVARGLIEKTILKTWQEDPLLQEDDGPQETSEESEVRQHLTAIRFWQSLRMADARSMVGNYAAVVLQLGDGKPYDQPVDRVPGGIAGVIRAFPAWQEQLRVSAWNSDPSSPAYGSPAMFLYNESAIDSREGKVRSFAVHPDRVLVWSRDGTVFGDSKLEPCYNALHDLEKIRGAGGEGFWKNAKSQPVLTADPDVNFNQLAAMLGVEVDELADKLDEVLEKFSKGFDTGLVLQGMQASTLAVTLPQPREFYEIAMQEVAASWPIPQKVLTGMQTGERASTEDAREWAQTCMARRSNTILPGINDLIGRFRQWGILSDTEWTVEWADLNTPTLEEKLTTVDKMATVNQKMLGTGDPVFTDDEMREVAGYDPTDAEFSEGDE